MSKAHIANHYIYATIKGALTQGQDAQSLLDAAKIPHHYLQQTKYKITEQQLNDLIQAVWKATQDEFMGLAPTACRLGTFALMAELAYQAKTLGGMLHQSARFYRVLHPDISLGFIKNSPVIIDEKSPKVFYQLQLNAQNKDPDHLMQEFLLIMWQRFSSWLVGQQIPYIETYFNYSLPSHAAEYRVMYSGKLKYQHDFCGFSLHPRYLQLPLVRTHSELVYFLRSAPGIIFHYPEKDERLQTQLKKLLQAYDFDAMPTLDQLASQLHMTPRTLKRRLNHEGIGIRQLKDELRRDFALKLLSAENFSVQEISEKTGFSESAAFCHAFKRWTGLSPKQWKK
ncbi:AraC-type DNA-binding protein [Allopseudospirillum japonicum]|uniref:AraC-type DNA-binding protein n=1 Tax=Allopseudospirillum japonicum TaxID=64971 RepID=A0A1H6TYB6_9GAMM|nr:AraC family transcriptional regulator [Allopseudospirillum japonicum]SEI84196.1 AraC-type DNA-binding protein [Allopseudospirillum japonicum]